MSDHTTQVDLAGRERTLPAVDCPTTKPCQSAGSPGAAAAARDVPSLHGQVLPHLNGYDVLVEVGRGGMGIVYESADPQRGISVAIKVLTEALAAIPKARRRFIREAKAAASVVHPQVVSILDVGEHEGNPYFVMEFLRGGSLQARLRRKTGLPAIPIASVLRIAHQVALGLQAAHDMGIVHRDIKPGNLLFVGDGDDIKITDFGIARVIEGDPSLRSSTSGSTVNSPQAVGTPAYMSPEQVTGEELDYRSDLFSLGAVIHAMVTCRSPFDRPSLMEVIEAVLQSEPVPLHTLHPDVPRELSELVLQLLAKHPDQRIQTAAEVAERLQRITARHVQQIV